MIVQLKEKVTLNLSKRFDQDFLVKTVISWGLI